MEAIQAVILGIIQGITEFLPISSSGHLVIFQRLFGLKEPELFFDVSVHIGTLAAVVIFFWNEIRSIIISLLHFFKAFSKKEVSFANIYEDAEAKLALMIVIGSIPTGIIGLLLSKGADKIFSSVSITGFMLLINGLLLWSTRRIKKEGAADFSIKKALLIGIVQGLAVIPGISRSGSTIATAIFLGLNKEMAVRYSFLLSIPAIIGAEILVLKDLSDPMISFSATLMGTVSAFIIGYFSLKLLLYIVKKRQLHFFAPYCWIIGLVALFWGWQTP
tara:strand:+ start:2597 stop:3421 length:825 start_codon:yes stop_codon:yes gene_type:complete